MASSAIASSSAIATATSDTRRAPLAFSNLHRYADHVQIELLLKKSMSPIGLFQSLELDSQTDEFSCFEFVVDYASQSTDEAAYERLDPLVRTRHIVQDMFRRQQYSGRLANLTANMAMYSQASDFFSILALAVGLAHHWSLQPLLPDGTAQAADGITQTGLLKEKMSMATFTRQLRASLSVDGVPQHKIRLVLSLQAGFKLEPFDTVTSSVWQATKLVPASEEQQEEGKGGKGKKIKRDSYRPKAKLPCLVTRYLVTEGAHLIDNKYKGFYRQIISALNDAFKASGPDLDEYLVRLKTGLSQEIQLPGPIMTTDNDIIPLEPTIHTVFDIHDAILFNPLGDCSWLWLSAKLSPPMAAAAMLEGVHGDPFDACQQTVDNHLGLAPTMLASAVKIALKALGTAELWAAYGRLALKLEPEEDFSVASSSSSKRPSSSSRALESGSGRQAKRSSFGPGPPADRATSSRSAPTSSSRPTSSGVSAYGRQHGLATLPPSDPPGSEVWDEELPGLTFGGSSSSGARVGPDTSASLEATEEPGRKTIAGVELGLEAASAAEEKEETMLEAEEREEQEFHDLWVLIGKEGTQGQRRAANMLERLASIIDDAIQVLDEDDWTDKAILRQAGEAEETYEEAKVLIEHKQRLLTSDHYKWLQAAPKDLDEALQLIEDEQQLQALLKDRFNAAFWMGLPQILMHHQIVAT